MSAPKRRSEIYAAFGTVVEWYDFSLFVYLAPVYSVVFFGDSGGQGLIATFAVFAITYFARPIGAIAFGAYGDRHGRRASLTVSALMMAVALAANAMIPSESAIGILAAVLLVLTRLAMGFAVGGEYSGILVFLVETSSDRWRGFVASWSPATSGIGILLAVASSAWLTNSLSADQLQTWGWRLPLVIGAGLALLVLALRRRIEETEAFTGLADSDDLVESPLRAAFSLGRRPMVIVFAVALTTGVAYYLNVTFIPTLLSSYEGVPSGSALNWSTIAAAAMLVTTPLFGALADVLGRRTACIGATVLIAVTTVPLFALFGSGTDAALLGATVALSVIVGAAVAVEASTLPEQFPSRIRFTALSIAYNVAVLFAGLTPLMATVIVELSDSTLAPAVWCTVFAVIGIVACLFLRETARRPLRS
ncbi:MAG: MFS transporter [Actinomycetota bacterium]